MRQGRVRHLAWIGAVLVAALVGRLFQMQVVQGEHWADEARLSRIEVRTIPFRRGRILDRDGRVLAEDRFSYELHCNYREFRRGHPAGQLLEALLLYDRGLVRRELPGGLADVMTRAEQLGKWALGWTAEGLQVLSPRDREDLCFYLRGLCGLDAPGMSTAVLAWAHGGSGAFGEAFPSAVEGMLRRVAEARAALAELEAALGPDWQGALLARIEEGRQGLERRIRFLAVDQALGNALPEIGARAARAALAGDGEDGAALLAALGARWGPDLDAAELQTLRQVVTRAVEDEDQADALRGDLLDRIGRLAPQDLDGVRRRLVLSVHNERVLTLQRDLAYAPADLVKLEAERYPGLYVQDVPDRVYPLDVAPHLVGRLGAMSDEELAAYKDKREEFQDLSRAFYRSQADERRYQELRHEFLARVQHPGEARGVAGVERAFDMVLRGERGYVQVLEGGDDGERPRELVFEPPRHGHDVVLTLDAGLQRAAEEAIRRAYADAREDLDPRDKRFVGAEGAARLAATRAALAPGRERAAIAVIDLQDGGLPVLATLPSYPRSIFQDREAYARVAEDRTAAPLRQRALGGMPNGDQMPYPGSTFKLVVAAAALAADPGWYTRRFDCNRHLEVPPGTPMSCESAHGLIDMHTAVQESCNIYFYLLAKELGYERIHDFARRLGFGRPTGIELVPVRAGADGGWEPYGADAALETLANGLLPPGGHVVKDTMRLGIGQTRVWASPLQLARFYAWLADGSLPVPRLIREGAGASPAAPAERPPSLTDASRKQLAQSLYDVVLVGTAEDALRPLEEFGVVGKTGTAQVGEDVLVHAWFAGYFPREAPRYAFAVLCENAGLHGGEIASDALYYLLASAEGADLTGARGE